MDFRFYSDGTEYYVKVTRAAHDVALVGTVNYELSVGLRALRTAGVTEAYAVFMRDGREIARKAMKLCPDKSTEKYERYEALVTLEPGLCEFYFDISLSDGKISYKKDHPIRFCPEFSVPEWSLGMVCYQIYIDRFLNGNAGNDVCDREYYYHKGYSHHVTDWYKCPDELDVHNFYGGDLQGVMHKLDYLKELGVEAIYFNPLFVSPSNHKYDTQDYDYIDPHIAVIVEDGGDVLSEADKDNANASRYRLRTADIRNLEASNAYFAEFVSQAHKRGIKVILDGVFNHCGSFHKWMDREGIYSEGDGAYMNPASSFRRFFKFEEQGCLGGTADSSAEASDDGPDNETDRYEGWWDYKTLPKLNYEESDELCDEIIRIARKWVSPPYNADGWRLDVAADLGHSEEFNHSFWQRFRAAVKDANPDALILAENYGDSRKWLHGNEWDTIMNYEAFMEPVGWFLTGMDKHSKELRPGTKGDSDLFIETMEKAMSGFTAPSLYCAMNELSNHDHSRFLTRTNGIVGRSHDKGSEAAEKNVNKRVFMEAVVMQMTWPGAPTIYYGDEAGLCGFTDPDSRRTYPWGREDKDLLEFHREMTRLRRHHKVLKRGSHIMLASGPDMLAYGRFSENERVIVVINNGTKPQQLTIPVYPAYVEDTDTLTQIMETGSGNMGRETHYSLENKKYPVQQGMLEVTIGPESAMIFV